MLVGKWHRLRTCNPRIGEVGRALQLQRHPQEANHEDQPAYNRCLCDRVGPAMKDLRHEWKLSVKPCQGFTPGLKRRHETALEAFSNLQSHFRFIASVTAQ
jgi:hypothetical protein